MVTFNVYKSTASGTYVEGVCLTTDEKPIAGIANGSILFAVDPSDGSMTRYMFDQNSATWIEATCPGSGDGGSSLPEVTSDDNGDVLTVVDGAWGKAAPSGGGLLVTVTLDAPRSPDHAVISAEDAAAIKTTIAAGGIVWLLIPEIPGMPQNPAYYSAVLSFAEERLIGYNNHGNLSLGEDFEYNAETGGYEATIYWD